METMEQSNALPVKILLVEDNQDDVFLTIEAFKKVKVKNSIATVGDGVEALDYLRHKGEYSNVKRPDIILLDLNLPRKDGFEVLKEVKEDPELKAIPIIVLTASKADEDAVKSYAHYANCFISKPVRMEEFNKIIREIEEFWFLIVKLPREKTNKLGKF
ncbi:MAG: response regulator [Elusimicrobiota bacterium]|nr:response regulator [Elusimicrobiota bacterium]